MTETDRKESGVRSRARRLGYAVRKSRRQISLDNLGDYMVLDVETNSVVFGSRFDATLDEIEHFLRG